MSSEFLVVRAGASLHAVLLPHIVEVVRPPPCAALPRVPSYLLGAAQFRAEVIPVIELAGRLGLLPDAPSGKARVVVVRATAGRAGLWVGEVVGVWRGFEPHDGVLSRGDACAALLDLERVVDWRAG